MIQLQSQEAALFVYLAWGTRGGRSLLESDQIRRIVYQAITCRCRSLFCHILAIDGTATAIHLIARFPASLSISEIARMSRAAGGDVIVRWEEEVRGHITTVKTLWDPNYTGRTLWLDDEKEATAYLRNQIASAEQSVSEEPIEEHDWNLAKLGTTDY